MNRIVIFLRGGIKTSYRYKRRVENDAQLQKAVEFKLISIGYIGYIFTTVFKIDIKLR
jgi:hypothetical protein